MCTKTCTSLWLEGWSTRRSTDLESSLSGPGPGRPAAPTVRNLIVGRSTGWSTDRSFWHDVWPQRRVFGSLFKGLLWAVLDKIFWRVSKPVFSSLLEVFSTYFRANISISKECFSNKISWVFFHKSILVFLTHIWAFQCHINLIRALLWELFCD